MPVTDPTGTRGILSIPADATPSQVEQRRNADRISTLERRVSQLTKRAPAAQDAWKALTLINGWTGTLWYRIRPDGTVRLEGAVGNGASGTNVAVLPAGYRPYRNQYQVLLGDFGNAGNYAAFGTDGTITGIRTGATLYFANDLDTGGWPA